VDRGPRSYDCGRRQYVPDRCRVLRRVRVHGGRPHGGRTARRYRDGDRRCVQRNHDRRGRKHGDRNVSLADPMPATNREMPAPLRFYLVHERAILGALMVILFLLAWEGLERGWWAQLLRPFIGASAERWQLKPIFISSPTLVAQSAFRM